MTKKFVISLVAFFMVVTTCSAGQVVFNGIMFDHIRGWHFTTNANENGVFSIVGRARSNSFISITGVANFSAVSGFDAKSYMEDGMNSLSGAMLSRQNLAKFNVKQYVGFIVSKIITSKETNAQSLVDSITNLLASDDKSALDNLADMSGSIVGKVLNEVPVPRHVSSIGEVTNDTLNGIPCASVEIETYYKVYFIRKKCHEKLYIIQLGGRTLFIEMFAKKRNFDKVFAMISETITIDPESMQF